ncbi:RTA1-domain-containing protein [Coniochaeta ligniaria NRRL 30616]|uniref:RTA1-domain-containing protein n=1 Tax=Coniochaeta ligniaria NRRL 30616 TaxID=1408157 RepID=A0A1J7J3D5_9PEZI|nr:RTA1-domain-containing protein [Coniochaeta ligniaria NRRL 30616]
MPTLESHNGYLLWHYIPSIAAAIVFAIIFALLTAVHLWRMIQTRMWFCLPFVIGGFFEIIGYGGRAAATNSTGELMPYIIQSMFLLLPPVLFAASLYMVLGRLIRSVQAERYSIIPPRWLTKVFVAGDVASFFIQGGGAGIMVGGKADSMKTGQNVVVCGLILQVVMFAVFIVTGLHFNLRFRSRGNTETWAHVPWQRTLNMLYVTSGFVMVRNIFRVVEYVGGTDGYLLSTEWPLYVFDGALMVFTMSYFLWRYPSELKAHLSHPDMQLRSTDGDSVAHLSAERSKPERY